MTVLFILQLAHKKVRMTLFTCTALSFCHSVGWTGEAIGQINMRSKHENILKRAYSLVLKSSPGSGLGFRRFNAAFQP